MRDLNDSGQVRANLGDPSLTRGFTSLHVGYRGRIVVTAAPLQNAEGLKGIFQFAFWSRGGDLHKSVKLEGPRTGIVDEKGESILLLGQSDALAFDHNGNELWRVAGSFRKGVLAAGGSLALINPSKAINEVHVVRSGTVTIVTLPGPVHELAATPDGSLAAIATDGGKVSFILTGSCSAGACPVQPMPALAFGGTYYITAIKFIDRANIALGVIEASGTPPNVSFDRGHVIVAAMDAPGEVPQVDEARAKCGLEPAAGCYVRGKQIIRIHAGRRIRRKGQLAAMKSKNGYAVSVPLVFLAGIHVACGDTTWPIEPVDSDHPVGNTMGEFIVGEGGGYQHEGIDILGTPYDQSTEILRLRRTSS